MIGGNYFGQGYFAQSFPAAAKLIEAAVSGDASVSAAVIKVAQTLASASGDSSVSGAVFEILMLGGALQGDSIASMYPPVTAPANWAPTPAGGGGDWAKQGVSAAGWEPISKNAADWSGRR